ncbi:uncharacterized protein LOC119286114 isoform X1 [Triticum dicoccoides]|uniref:uncharacterized protein LOC119286114 isoform X1 n=1 Tax=Triticum dicoccoides TaxID=85692 RepID=UPI0003D51885|nr:uncharacterized protein LOC119286114 isoform X1 [Triticum dicoccoides]XP_044363981.1 uncharacterized protein LOC123086297 isoform X1 [Triticum aestivum]
MALLFFDLSLLPSPNSNSRLLAAARALELGYAAVALDHPHRGLLADADRCHTAPFPALSSLPLPPSASLHRSRNGSPTSEPFRQYTRITLSLDSAAAAASALAPSAARLLRTYDIVAARPLTQAALDHLCQSATEIDVISIDFSHKLPFRLKLPTIKLALQRGIHFEIAYSPLIDDVNSRRQVLAEANLLVDWTKGKNLIISSAAHNANEIRGPYDVINLCAFLLGLSMERAKAAMSVNCRLLISKATRKKHFYKETIRIDRLLPNEQLNSTKYKVGDWIGLDPISFKGDRQTLETNLEPSPNKDELPVSPTNFPAKVLCHKRHDADVSLFADRLEQSTDDSEIPVETQEETLQANRSEAHSGAVHTIMVNPENNEIVMAGSMQACVASSVDQKCIEEHVEFVEDAMELDATELCTLNLISGDGTPLSSDVKLPCSSLPQSMELFDTSLENKDPDQPSKIVDHTNTCANQGYIRTSGDREEQAPLDHEIVSCSDVCLEGKCLDKPDDVPVDSKTHRDAAESLGCSTGGRDDETPLNLTVPLSTDLCEDIVLPAHQVEQNVDEDIKSTDSYKVEPVYRNAIRMISVENTLSGQEISSAAVVYDKGSSDETRENNELEEQNLKKPNASLEKDVAKIDEGPLNYDYADKVDISTARSEKRRQKLLLHGPSYIPFLGFLKPVSFKKKVCKVRGLVKSLYHIVCLKCAG